MDNSNAILIVVFLYVMTILLICSAIVKMDNEPDVEMTYATESNVIEQTDSPETVKETLPEASTMAPETTNEETVETVEEVTETTVEMPKTTVEIKLYYDVPLDEALQDHIFALCESYGIDPAVVISIIARESSFRPGVMGDKGESYGLMQIKKKWHIARMERLGVTDLLDPYQNVTVGIDLLAELLRYGDSLEWALMCYNGGYAYADKRIESGNISDYAKGVISMSNSLELQPVG